MGGRDDVSGSIFVQERYVFKEMAGEQSTPELALFDYIDNMIVAEFLFGLYLEAKKNRKQGLLKLQKRRRYKTYFLNYVLPILEETPTLEVWLPAGQKITYTILEVLVIHLLLQIKNMEGEASEVLGSLKMIIWINLLENSKKFI
ncbi:hypothetical protein ACJX0J_031283, partial [Zea mays]